MRKAKSQAAEEAKEAIQAGESSLDQIGKFIHEEIDLIIRGKKPNVLVSVATKHALAKAKKAGVDVKNFSFNAKSK